MALVLVAAGMGASVGTPITGEASVVATVAEVRTAWLADTARLVTHLGDLWVVATIAGLVAVLARDSPVVRGIRVQLVLTIGGSALIVAVLKLLVARPRPEDALIATFTSAFPSGHAARAAAVYGLVVWAVHRYVRQPVVRSVGMAGALIGGIWLGAVLRTVPPPDPPARSAPGRAPREPP